MDPTEKGECKFTSILLLFRGEIEQLGVPLKWQAQDGEEVPFLLDQEEKLDLGLKGTFRLPLPASHWRCGVDARKEGAAWEAEQVCTEMETAFHAHTDVGTKRTSRAGTRLLCKPTVTSSPLQLLFRCLLLPFSSPFSYSQSWWHKHHQQWWSDSWPECSQSSVDSESPSWKGGMSGGGCRGSGLSWRERPSPIVACLSKVPLPPSSFSWCMRCGTVGNPPLQLVPTLGQVEVSAWCYGCCACSASLLCQNCIPGSLQLSLSSSPQCWVGATDRWTLAPRASAVWVYFNVKQNRNYLSIAIYQS